MRRLLVGEIFARPLDELGQQLEFRLEPRDSPREPVDFLALFDRFGIERID